MPKNFSFRLAILFLALAPSSSLATEINTPSPWDLMTSPELLVDWVLQNDVMVSAAQANVDAASAQIKQAGVFQNPSFEFSMGNMPAGRTVSRGLGFNEVAYYEVTMNTKSTTTNGKLKGLIGIGGAIAISTVSVIAAASFQRPPPPVPAKPIGVVYHEDGIDLSSESPAWKVLKLGQVELAQDRWTDAVPARVKINESRANKLGAPLAGRVIKTHVELGEAVAAGDPLFSVASRDIAELRAELNLADLEVSVAKANLARVQAMVKAGALPAKKEVAARQEHQKAVLARRLAAAKLGATKVNEDSHSEYTVQSPIDGFLVEKRVTSGQEVGPEVLESLATVADLTTVWVVADLFEADAVDVVVGAKAEITSPSLPGVKMEGKVDMVSSVVDPSRHTVPIRVSLENPEGLLRPNIYANVRFETKAKKGLVEIPASALLSDGTVQSVFIEKSTGVFKKQPIVAGSVRGGILPVFEGLEVGDTIVVEGAILLHNAMALAQTWSRKLYKPVLSFSLKNPVAIGILAAGAMASALVLMPRLGSEFLPELNEGSLYVTFTLPENISLTEGRKLTPKIKDLMRRTPEITGLLTQIGRPEDGTDPTLNNNFEVFVKLKPMKEWRPDKKTLDDLIAEIDVNLMEIPGIEYNFSQPIRDNVNENISGQFGQIAVKIYGEDLEILQELAEQVKNQILTVPGAADVGIVKSGEVPQIAVQPDRAALARYDLDLEDVQDFIETAMGGHVASEMWQGEKRFDVVVRLPQSTREDVGAIERVMLPLEDGALIPLSAVADVNMGDF